MKERWGLWWCNNDTQDGKISSESEFLRLMKYVKNYFDLFGKVIQDNLYQWPLFAVTFWFLSSK